MQSCLDQAVWNDRARIVYGQIGKRIVLLADEKEERIWTGKSSLR
jgi:hypothetical protein